MSERTVRVGRRQLTIDETVLDRVVEYFSPEAGNRRLRHKLAAAAVTGGYNAGKRGRRQLSEWQASDGNADAVFLPEQILARSRARDLVRNNPIAAGAVMTYVDYVVGQGLQPRPRIDRQVLGLTEAQADEWERQAQREWSLFAATTECDYSRTLNFAGLTALACRSTFESGDIVFTMPFLERPGSPYGLKLQAIEGDRVSNPNYAADKDNLAGGIERDPTTGAPVACHITNGHPGAWLRDKSLTWQRVEMYSSSGRRRVLHLFEPLRPGQSRGVPAFAPVIETLKMLDRYTEAELMAAVVSGMYTVFIETPTGQGMAPMEPTTETGASASDTDIKLGVGAVLELMPGEKVSTANPGRPNAAFDPFTMALLKHVAVGLGMPYELLLKHFTSSYSASKGALLVAWKRFFGRRRWLAANFCQPVYEAWMLEAVARERLPAPGFLTGDPAIRAAYLGCEWSGDAQGHLDELKEAQAARERVSLGISTLDIETAAITGQDWEQVVEQRGKEERRKRELGLVPQQEPAKPAGSSSPAPDDERDDEDDRDDEGERDDRSAFGVSTAQELDNGQVRVTVQPVLSAAPMTLDLNIHHHQKPTVRTIDLIEDDKGMVTALEVREGPADGS